MKHSIVFFSSWAAMAAAAPFDEQRAAIKLPYKEPGLYFTDCDFRGIDEESCGTKRYCEAFDKSPRPTDLDGTWKNSKACFDAHEPRDPSKQPSETSQTDTTKAGKGGASAKLPFVKAGDVSDLCFPGQFEECLGTQRYCDSQAWKKKDEPKYYTSAQACFADREPSQPSDELAPTKKPWIFEPETVCKASTEECSGTELFCARSKKVKSKDCFAERETPKLPWLAPGTCTLNNEACLGTEGWCSFLEKYYKTNTTECVARRVHKP